MAKSYPQIQDARSLAKRDNLLRCVVLFQLDDGRVGYASYGKTKELCEDTRKAMDDVFDDIEIDFVYGWKKNG